MPASPHFLSPPAHHHRPLPLFLPSLLLFLLFLLLSSPSTSLQGSPPACPNEEPARCVSVLAREELSCNSTLCCGGKDYTLVSDMCPFSCGLCEQPCPGKTCKNHGVMDYDTCTCECPGHLGGPTCEDCVEDDEPWCTQIFTKSMCGKPGGPMFQLCPHFCGLCPGTCPEVQCQNEGRVKVSSCTCQCVGNFTGEFCELCPKEDLSFCLYMDSAMCKESSYNHPVPLSCPHLCDKCSSTL